MHPDQASWLVMHRMGGAPAGRRRTSSGPQRCGDQRPTGLRRRAGWWLVGLGLKLAVGRGQAGRRPRRHRAHVSPRRRARRAGAPRGWRRVPILVLSPTRGRCGRWRTRCGGRCWRRSPGRVRSPRRRRPSWWGSRRPTARSTSARWPSTASSRRPRVARAAPVRGGAPRSPSPSRWSTPMLRRRWRRRLWPTSTPSGCSRACASGTPPAATSRSGASRRSSTRCSST